MKRLIYLSVTLLITILTTQPLFSQTPNVVILDATVDESSGAAMVTVVLSEASANTIVVDYITEAAMASPEDFNFMPDPMQMVFSPGTTSLDLAFEIWDDAIDEISESFYVSLLSASGATILDQQAEVTIIDNDAAPLISINDLTVNEGDGAGTITVNSSSVSGLAISFDYVAIDISTTAGADHTLLSGTFLTIPAGSVSTTFTFAIIDDLLSEGNEKFDVILSNVTNATLLDSVATVTIIDNDDELTITCGADISVSADIASCQAMMSIAPPMVTGMPAGSVLSNDMNATDDASGNYPVGTTVVFWTVDDGAGNTATCSQNITITDDEDPMIICAPDQIHTVDIGMDNAVIIAINPIPSDNCLVGALINDFNGTADASDTYPLGTTTVTWTVFDVSGNTSTCSQDITIEADSSNVNSIPTAMCQDITVVLDVTGSVTISAFDIDNGSTDDTMIAGLDLDQYDFDCSDLGANNVMLTVTNNNGNSATCNSIVTVADNTDPILECQDIDVTLNSDGITMVSVNDLIIDASDNCGISEIWATASTFDATDIGVNTVEVIGYDYMGNSANCVATVTVEAASNGNDEIIGDLDFEMWPNPTLGDVVISKPGKYPGFSVRVMDLTGKIIYDLQYDTESKIKLDLNDLDSGIYTVTMSQGGQSVTKKIIRAK